VTVVIYQLNTTINRKPCLCVVLPVMHFRSCREGIVDGAEREFVPLKTLSFLCSPERRYTETRNSCKQQYTCALTSEVVFRRKLLGLMTGRFVPLLVVGSLTSFLKGSSLQ